MTLLQLRNDVIRQIVADEVHAYLTGKRRSRPCASCGSKFQPRMRWHFCCSHECRRDFYRGQFNPRPRKRQRRAA